MTLFGTLGIAASGMTLHRTWLDAVSDNIANVSTVRATWEDAYRSRTVVAQEVADGGGVRVAGIALGAAEGRLSYEPDHPLADASGYVRRADVDLADQMTQLIQAQRGYQANAAVVERARASYEAALQIGRS